MCSLHHNTIGRPCFCSLRSRQQLIWYVGLKITVIMNHNHVFMYKFFLQQARAEQEEEYISNTLLKKINSLKREKELLAVNYEHEEEFLTNDLTRQLNQVSEW